MANVQELLLDVEELQKFLEVAERQKVKEIVANQIKRIQDEISILQQDKEPKFPKPQSSTTDARCYEVKLNNYAWDQSDKFVKIYVTLSKVHTIPKENIKCEFSSKAMELSVNGLEKKNYSLVLGNLLEPIIADASHFKIKTDMVVIFMKKDGSKTWSNLTVQDRKTKEPKLPKMDEDADPSKSLMDMMKQMYDDGDDEMKRTIAKAWTESRNKSPDVEGL